MSVTPSFVLRIPKALGCLGAHVRMVHREKSEEELGAEIAKDIWGKELEKYMVFSGLNKKMRQTTTTDDDDSKTLYDVLKDAINPPRVLDTGDVCGEDVVVISKRTDVKYDVTWNGKTYDAIMKPLPTVVECFSKDTDVKYPNRVYNNGQITHALYVCPTTQTVDGLSPGLVNYDAKFKPIDRDDGSVVSPEVMKDACDKISGIVEALKKIRAVKTPKPEKVTTTKKGVQKVTRGYFIGGKVTLTYDDVVFGEPWMSKAPNGDLMFFRKNDRFRSSVMNDTAPYVKQEVVARAVARVDVNSLLRGAEGELNSIQRLIESEQCTIDHMMPGKEKDAKQMKLNELITQLNQVDIGCTK